MVMTLRQRSMGLKAILFISIGLGSTAAAGYIGEAHPRHRVDTGEWVEPGVLSSGFREVEGVRGDASRTSSDRMNFILGRDFSLAAFNASRLKKDQHATKHLIVDLVYLIDRLEGKSEAGSLRKVLTQVVRDSAERDVVAAGIEAEAERYRSRLKGTELWSFDVGYTALHLTLASYNNAESAVREDIGKLRALGESSPDGMSEVALEKISALQRFVAETRIADEDYQKIFYATWELLEALGG